MWIFHARATGGAAAGLDGVDQQAPESASLLRRIDRQHAEVAVVAMPRPVDAPQRTRLRPLDDQEFAALLEIVNLLDRRAIAALEEALDHEGRIDQPGQLGDIIFIGGADDGRWGCRERTIEGARRGVHGRGSWYTPVLAVAQFSSPCDGSTTRTVPVGR